MAVRSESGTENTYTVDLHLSLDEYADKIGLSDTFYESIAKLVVLVCKYADYVQERARLTIVCGPTGPVIRYVMRRWNRDYSSVPVLGDVTIFSILEPPARHVEVFVGCIRREYEALIASLSSKMCVVQVSVAPTLQ